MVFSSLMFLYVYLIFILVVYFISPKKMKNFVMFAAGLFFYAWGEPVYIVIMVISTLIDYTAGLMIHKFDNKPKMRTVFLLVSLFMNLGLLFVFKYSSFVITNINDIFNIGITDPKLALPIGISFYTFQSMSYTIDMYMRKIKVQKNFISFAAYVTLFPQIVAGPIVRYEDVAREIDNRTINVNKISIGIGLFVKGLAKKVILANNIGMIWSQIKAMDYETMPALTAWIGILAFTFQIYFDFSGYSDMACGLGKMLGFNFPQNFNYPYVSKSISEFWRRWHITLGDWFRSYVYIPLGGNRKGMWKTLRNLLIVWALTGLWHGASWNFVLWGLYFGILIIIERIGWGKVLEKLPSFVSIAYTFVLVVFGWVLFDTNTLTDAFNYIGAMFGAGGSFANSYSMYVLLSNLVLFAICIFASTQVTKNTISKIRRKSRNAAIAIAYSAPVVELALMILCTAYLVDATYNPFLYFRF